MPSSSAPSVETLEIGRQSVALHEVRLASPEHGEVHLCFADDVCVRLAEDDLLRLPSGGGCRARAAQGVARLRVLRVGRVWLAQALGLLDAPDGGACVDRAGSEEARRARRLFDAHVHPGAAEEGESLRDAARRLELLALALESQPFEPTSAGLRRRNHGREALVRMVAALRDASLEEVSLASLALELGLSERQVSRLFREEFGTTFRQHVSSLRLERAKRLLAATDLPVIEVAGHTGWSSLAHFNTVFRRRVGVTPSAFRSARIELARV
jgi:AraC-like DNA-binding protein